MGTNRKRNSGVQKYALRRRASDNQAGIVRVIDHSLEETRLHFILKPTGNKVCTTFITYNI